MSADVGLLTDSDGYRHWEEKRGESMHDACEIANQARRGLVVDGLHDVSIWQNQKEIIPSYGYRLFDGQKLDQ